MGSRFCVAGHHQRGKPIPCLFHGHDTEVRKSIGGDDRPVLVTGGAGVGRRAVVGVNALGPFRPRPVAPWIPALTLGSMTLWVRPGRRSEGTTGVATPLAVILVLDTRIHPSASAERGCEGAALRRRHHTSISPHPVSQWIFGSDPRPYGPVGQPEDDMMREPAPDNPPPTASPATARA